MKKDRRIPPCFPCYFFMFFTMFISVKFVFIFFFRAAYEPSFIFELTPFYILSGLNNLQLLVLSFIVIVFDTFLHVKITRRNLMYSFLPTAVMLCGLGLAIITREMTVSNLFHYLIFGCLLVVVLIDHKHFLEFSEMLVSTEKESIETEILKEKPVIVKPQPKVMKASTDHKLSRSSFSFINHLFLLAEKAKKTTGKITRKVKIKSIKQPKIASIKVENADKDNDKSVDEKVLIFKENFSKLEAKTRNRLQRAQDILNEFERRTKKLRHLEEEIEKRRKNLAEQERIFKDQLISSVGIKSSYNLSSMSKDKVVSDVHMDKESKEDQKVLDGINDCAAIIQRGILKQVNNSFAELIGFDTEKLRNKSLFNFIAPEGLVDLEKYYLGRLKGSDKYTYETVFSTKDNSKIIVEVSIKPTTYNGKKAEIAIIKELKNK